MRTRVLLLTIAGLHCAALSADGPRVFTRVRFHRPTPRSEVPAKPPAVMQIEPAQRPPTIDASLDDACWRAVKPFSPFVVYRTPDLAEENREVRMAFDASHLYVAAKLAKARGYALKAATQTNDDSHMWKDDELELFLDPGLSYSQYFQIIVNASGHHCDSHHAYQWVPDPAAADPDTLKRVRLSTPAWDSGLRVAVDGADADADEWTIEMALPVAALGLPAVPLGSRWGVNISSNNPRTKQLTNWIPGDWHEPQTYGHVLFGRPRLAVSDASFGNGWQGANLFRALFTNVEDTARRYRLRLFDPDHDSRVVGCETSFRVQPGQSAIAGATYAIAAGVDSARVVAQARDEGGRLLYQAQRKCLPPAPLKLRVHPYGRLAATPAFTAALDVRVGDLSLTRAALATKLIHDGRVIAQETVPVKDVMAELAIDAAGLAPGTYHLAVSLNIGDKQVAQVREPFAVTDSPFAMKPR